MFSNIIYNIVHSNLPCLPRCLGWASGPQPRSSSLLRCRSPNRVHRSPARFPPCDPTDPSAPDGRHRQTWTTRWTGLTGVWLMCVQQVFLKTQLHIKRIRNVCISSVGQKYILRFCRERWIHVWMMKFSKIWYWNCWTLDSELICRFSSLALKGSPANIFLRKEKNYFILKRQECRIYL